jgi:hypothetical protein
MSDLINKLIESDNVVAVGLMTLGLVAIFCGAMRSVVGSVTRERTRREIAAFIAEGTMTPEQGEKLMAAGQPKHGGGCC